MVRIPSVVTLTPAAGAGLLAPAAGALAAADGLLELAHADRARARAASPAAPSTFLIFVLLFTVRSSSPWGSRTGRPFSSDVTLARYLQPGGHREQNDRGRFDHEDRVGQPGGEGEAEAEDTDGAGQLEA